MLKIRNLLAATLLLSIFAAAPVLADSCYSEAEFEADRGLRLHSDMEVIMLTCRYSTQGEDLRKLYATFLKQNVGAIKGWENTIAKAYTGGGIGRSRNEIIDNFRTKLANQKANEAGRMGPKPFCKEWSDFVPFAAALSGDQVKAYVRAVDTARPTRRPPCNKSS